MHVPPPRLKAQGQLLQALAVGVVLEAQVLPEAFQPLQRYVASGLHLCTAKATAANTGRTQQRPTLFYLPIQVQPAVEVALFLLGEVKGLSLAGAGSLGLQVSSSSGSGSNRGCCYCGSLTS